jgi:hypothetical protein
MGAKIVTLTRPAEPGIDRVLDEFLEEQRERIRPGTQKKYEAVLDLLRSHLNGYAHEGLSNAESALFERHYHAEGVEHRDFCQLFGPEKIIENLGTFLGYFMIRKVIAGEDLMRAAGTVTKRLSKWLGAKGYVSDQAAREGADRGADAARNLPIAERAAQILRDHVAGVGIAPTDLAGKDFLEFDHFTIGRVGPGEIWLEHRDGRKMRSYGPISVPDLATKWLRAGWEISCSLGRVRSAWRIVEMANVYPG